MTADAQGLIIGVDGREGWAQPYQELIWEIPAKIPVTMITTTDDPREVEECYRLGCGNYITKPVDYDKFVEVIRQLGLFLLVVEVPKIKGN